MPKNLQKSAITLREIQRPHKGILDPKRYARNFQLRCYEPSKDLAPFIEHCFVSRWDLRGDPTYVASDVLSQSVVHLFFLTPGKAYASIETGKRTFKAKDTGLMAGAKFRPGGFYPFWQQDMSELVNEKMTIESVFPQVDEAFIDGLLSLQADAEIVTRIEDLLRTKQPVYDKNIELVNKIITKIKNDDEAITVNTVAQLFGMSERSLQLLFHTYVGVGVKWVIMRNRFLKAAWAAHTQKKPNWTVIAAELGYSTQSHFVNDFKSLVGLSPSKYVKAIKD